MSATVDNDTTTSVASSTANGGNASSITVGESAPSDTAAAPKNVFIRCLPRTMDSTGLAALVTSAAPGVTLVSARVMVDPRTDISLCYGFALLDSADEAVTVMRALHRRRLGGKTLSCKLSHSNVSLERPSADVAQVSNRLFVRGFPGTFTNADLRDLFEPFGKVLECTVLMRDDKKANKQVGLISMEFADDATRALSALHGYKIGNWPTMLDVRYRRANARDTPTHLVSQFGSPLSMSPPPLSPPARSPAASPRNWSPFHSAFGGLSTAFGTSSQSGGSGRESDSSATNAHTNNNANDDDDNNNGDADFTPSDPRSDPASLWAPLPSLWPRRAGNASTLSALLPTVGATRGRGGGAARGGGGARGRGRGRDRSATPSTTAATTAAIPADNTTPPSAAAATSPARTGVARGGDATQRARTRALVERRCLYVGRLPDALADEAPLRALFTPLGALEAVLMHRGYAFVTLVDAAAAARAVTALNDALLDGTRIVVAFARDHRPPAAGAAAATSARTPPASPAASSTSASPSAAATLKLDAPAFVPQLLKGNK